MEKLTSVYSGCVKDEWIDRNGHMVDHKYAAAFSEATDVFSEAFGVDDEYRRTSQCTLYTLEMHICFLRELHAGQSINISAQMIDADSKRVHAVLSMMNANGDSCAYCEILLMHVRAGENPGAEPFPPNLLKEIQTLLDMHGSIARPERANSTIAIRRRPQ